MGDKAVAAVLNISRTINAIASALISQCIQRTIAKKAIEILRMLCFVAGKILALLMLKERILMSLHFAPGILFHIAFLLECFAQVLYHESGRLSTHHESRKNAH